jgi:serine phosphatase RsbU (regulator of sigma subunit)
MSLAILFLIASALGLLGVNIYYWLGVKRRAEERAFETKLLLRREAMSKSILKASPNKEDLAEIFLDHLPLLFPESTIAVWLFLDKALFQFPSEGQHDLAVMTNWLSGEIDSDHIPEGEPLPWNPIELAKATTLIASIRSIEEERAIGGLIIELPNAKGRGVDKTFYGRLTFHLDSVDSVVESLSAYFGSISRNQQNLELQRVKQELNLASQIQTSFMPSKYPDMPGWQLAVALQPAGELSGDFFDLIPLSKDRVGVLIADVAGKGLGAALYMALSRTLVRTFATVHPEHPERVIADCNERILQDASAALFITAFYGVLDLSKNTLTYVNAGHHPPYLFSADREKEASAFHITGIPIGIDSGESWERELVEIAAGDTLLLYSDGVTDAQNAQGKEFGSERLLAEAEKHIGQPANLVQRSIIDRIRDFSGEVAQFDDITVLVLRREEN